MLSLLFIAHNFHQKTRSNLFFVEILKEHFDVTEVYLGPDRYALDASIFDVKPDYVVLWQLDYLAPIFLNKGIKTLVVPMYDASSKLGKRHWQLSSGAFFLSFSYELHSQITAAGCRSLLVKYFPEPSSSFVREYKELRAFWWMRQTSGVVSLEGILDRLGEELKSLHIHLVPDNPNANTERLKEEIAEEFLEWKKKKQPGARDFQLSISSWFDSEEDMLAILDKSNVYIAPRASEGIGMGFLKAMSKGMIVLAHDSPTHNEYIAHGVNGFLFSQKDESFQTISETAEVVGKLARKTAEKGYERWASLVPVLVDYVKSIPVPSHCVRYLSKESYGRISNAYFKGPRLYARSIENEVPAVLASSPGKPLGSPLPFQSSGAIVPMCAPDKNYGFGKREARQFFYEGWVQGESTRNWMRGREASLCFSFSEKQLTKSYSLKFTGRTTSKNVKRDKKPLKIFLNQKEIFSSVIKETYEAYETKIPLSLLKEREPNVLRFECDSLMKHKDFDSPISCVMESFQISEGEGRDPEVHLEEAYIKRKLLSKGNRLVSKIFS